MSSRPLEVQLDLADRTVRLATDAGVFSHGRLDSGTRILIREAPPPPAQGELLDLGSGYGPIAIWLAASAPGARVWAVDVNERALALTRDNADRAGLRNLVACRPGDVPGDLRLAAIYSNPPIRIGKLPLQELLLQWLGRLEPSGRAYLVVQQHLGADSLGRWLAQRGCAVRRVASKRAYRLLSVTPA